MIIIYIIYVLYITIKVESRVSFSMIYGAVVSKY